MNEKERWMQFLGKYIFVSKDNNKRTLTFKGNVMAVLDDKIILNDAKLGEIPLAFENLSVTGRDEERDIDPSTLEGHNEN